jgi:cell wall-associated NlpC family hydrolase
MSTPPLSTLERPFDAGPTFDAQAPDSGAAGSQDLLAAVSPDQSLGPTMLDAAYATKQAAADTARMNALTGTTITDTSAPVPQGNSKGAQIIRAAEQYLGLQYRWGGTSAAGVDCSGLVQLAYKAAGIALPRISYEQANSGMRVSLRALRPGDLVAWDNSTRNNGADHIAIYLGNGRIIEAARPGTKVRIRTLAPDEGAWGVRMRW